MFKYIYKFFLFFIIVSIRKNINEFIYFYRVNYLNGKNNYIRLEFIMVKLKEYII